MLALKILIYASKLRFIGVRKPCNSLVKLHFLGINNYADCPNGAVCFFVI